MATSLAQQLQRLATPQTSTLVESKKRASILFDSKEAATKDREIIFDIGINGLDDLIRLNPIFEQFRDTLFNQTTLNFERSVETGDVNVKLNKNIRKFLLLLSPHFLHRPASKCLEWLIRRFSINEYNIDDMMALILPYHETMMFVKCLQTMKLKNRKTPWDWIQVIQKPGVPLSKQAIINRAACDSSFLGFISNAMKKAVKELDTKAYTLQTMFAFYSTITLGALDVSSTITDSQVSAISSTLSKGLSSNVTDFCASSMIITGLLVTKTKLSDKFLNLIIEKLANISHSDLQKESVILLITIYQTHSDSLDKVNETLLARMIDNPSTTTTTLGLIYENNINVLPLCLPLLTASLQNIQLKRKGWELCKTFVDSLLLELTLKIEDAEAVIRCILNAYILRQKSKPSVINLDQSSDNSDIISVDSDNENEAPTSDAAKELNKWYSNLLKNFEYRCPEAFDRVTKEVMLNQDEDTSSERKSLKTVLGFLISTTYIADSDGADIFAELYHHSAINRMKAVEGLVNTITTMSFSDDSKNLLVDSISMSLSDSSPNVVQEVLKFKTEDLVKIVGEQNLIRKLKVIIGNGFINKSEWQNAITSAIKHITSSQLLKNDNEIEIFLAIWPYIFPYNAAMVEHTKYILFSHMANRFKFIKVLQKFKFNENNDDIVAFNEYVNDHMDFAVLPKINRIIQFVQTIPEEEITEVLAFHIINLLTHSISTNSAHKVSRDVLEIANGFLKQFQMNARFYSDFGSNSAQIIYQINTSRILPIQVIISCIRSIIGKTNFTATANASIIDFTSKNDELTLVIKLYEHLCTGLFTKEKKMSRLYNEVILEFFENILPTLDKKFDFFSNFFINHYIDQLADAQNFIAIDSALQLRSIRMFNALLTQTDNLNGITITTEVFIRLISGFTSPFEAVRITTCDTIDVLYRTLNPSSKYWNFFGLLLSKREEFSLDSNQLPLFLFLCFENKIKIENTIVKNEIKKLRDDLFEYIRRSDSATILKAALLNILKLIDSTVYLTTIVDSALSILNRINTDDRIILNPFESIIVNQTICHFNRNTISSISKPGNCREFFEKSLERSNVFMQVDRKVDSVAVIAMQVAMNIFKIISFNDLPKDQQKFIIKSIVKSATFSDNNDVRSKSSKFFRSIKLDAKIEFDTLTEMANIRVNTINESNERKKLRQSFTLELLHTPEWKCGITLLEFLQNNKQLMNANALIRQLFPVLQKCLDFDDQSMVEYTKQLILACMLHCCKLLSAAGLKPESDFRVELIVQCIRGTQNPQTHHHSLQLLTQLASMIPDILHCIMEIFTFVGTSIVRRDDAYIHQLISNVIKSIIPILIRSNNVGQQKTSVVPVLKVFTDIILDVPTHRRLRLYEDLLTTLQPMEFLWMFLAVLFESDVRNIEDGTKPDMKRTLAAVEITNLFSCDVIIETCVKLIKYLRELSSVMDPNKRNIDENIKIIFNAKLYTNYQHALYKRLILHFMNVLTAQKSEFAAKMGALSQESLIKYKPNFKNIIPAILEYIKASTIQGRTTEKVVGDGLSECYHILDHLLDLLYPDMLLQVVIALLGENNKAEVRIKIINLLNKKLHFPEFFTDCNTSILLLLEPLTNIVESITNDEKLVKTASHSDNLLLQQEALIAIQMMSKILAKNHPTEFANVLGTLAHILQSYEELQVVILVHLIQCITEVCANLRINAISHLHSFMPLITKVLDKHINETSATSSIFVYILTAIYRIVETLPLFLNPYLIKLIVSLSILWSRLLNLPTNDSQKVLLKLNDIWQKLASVLPLRVLIPMIDKTYSNLLIAKEFNAIGPLMNLLSDSFGHLESTDLVQNCNDLTTFFIGAMEFRSKFCDVCKTVDVQESFIIKTFVDFILKLSEGSFRPLYNKVYEWSIENVGLSYDRAVTFYRLTTKIAESLKSLFMTFAMNIIQNAVDLLTKNYTKAEINASSTNSSSLIYSILETLHMVFLYNTKNVNRYSVLIEPIVNLLDNENYSNVENIQEILPKCLAQLAAAGTDDTWRQLNYQILLKTRSNSVSIRRCALICSVEVVKKLGDNFTLLLPETIPFYAELMEDENPEIENLCHASIREIEKVLNEPLQKYF